MQEPSFKASARQLVMIGVLVSLSVLFACTLVAYLVTRSGSAVWRTAHMPGLPIGLLGSTVLLAGVSGALHRAVAAVRQNRVESLTRALWLSLAFGVAFLVGQALNWRQMLQLPLEEASRSLYQFTFFMLTGVHALHVAAGFIPLGIVISRARRREYSSSRHEGLRYCVQYWDFLGIVWLVLLTALYFAT